MKRGTIGSFVRKKQKKYQRVSNTRITGQRRRNQSYGLHKKLPRESQTTRLRNAALPRASLLPRKADNTILLPASPSLEGFALAKRAPRVQAFHVMGQTHPTAF